MRRFLITLLCLTPWLAQAQLESTSDLQRGLVGWWRFNEGTGTNAFDLSGNANTGTLSGSTLPVWTNGVFGGALWLDGTAAYVDCGNVTQANFGAGAFTVSFWVKALSTNSLTQDRGIITKDTDGGGGNGLYIEHVSSFFKYWTGAAYINFGAQKVGNWEHLLVVRRGTSVGQTETYYNGSLANTGTDSRTLTNTRHLLFGVFTSGSFYFNGLIDDVRIYSRALSATEVLNIYCQGGGRTP